LKTRIEEHSSNIKLNSSNHSVISEHILQFSHNFDRDNVKILDFESNFYKKSVSKMIHTKEQKNDVNSQTDTELLDKSYFNIPDRPSKL